MVQIILFSYFDEAEYNWSARDFVDLFFMCSLHAWTVHVAEKPGMTRSHFRGDSGLFTKKSSTVDQKKHTCIYNLNRFFTKQFFYAKIKSNVPKEGHWYMYNATLTSSTEQVKLFLQLMTFHIHDCMKYQLRIDIVWLGDWCFNFHVIWSIWHWFYASSTVDNMSL